MKKAVAMLLVIMLAVFGQILATTGGSSGIARMLDKEVDSAKTQSQEMAK